MKRGVIHTCHKPRLICFSLLVAVLVYLLPLSISAKGKVVLAILICAAMLWVTEALPLFLTSLIVFILTVLFRVLTFKKALQSFVDPIVILLFGGFLIALAMEDVGLDKHIGKQITKNFRDDKHALLALMYMTAFLSMWISNTAATVIMIPIALGIVAKFKKMQHFSKATVLGIAYSANVGGVGTLIGTPPNAITVAQLGQLANVHISFAHWLLKAFPFVLLLVPLIWLVLLQLFPFQHATVRTAAKVKKLTFPQKEFMAIFAVTVMLWLTTGVHGLSSSFIALLSATALFLFKILRIADLQRVNYQILILVGGGMLLGQAMFTSGLSTFFGEQLAAVLAGKAIVLIITGVALFAIVLSSFASNTATASILVPVVISMASALNTSTKMLAIVAGVAVSCSFLLPVSTPPNALAYATGKIKTKDMLYAGISTMVIAVAVIVVFALYVWV
jgi:solute carrier family 13 (sodium-dependent dicarboxylate transporter), member 2/3/5